MTRVRCLAAAIVLCACTGVYAQSDAVLLRKNLEAAEKALRGGEYDEALLSVRAALQLSPHNQQARVIEMDVYIAKGENLPAMDAALKAIDASKRGDKNSSKNSKKVQKYIKQQSPSLSTFIDLRSGVVDDLLKLRKSALRDNRAADAEWIVGAARKVFPTHAELEDIAGAGIPRVHEIKVEPGMISLLGKKDDWELYNVAKECGLKDGILSLKQDEVNVICDAGYKSAELKKDFKVSFELKYKRRPEGRDPHISIMFTNAPLVSALTSIHSIGIDPYGRKRILFAFINPQGERGWKELGANALPADTIPEGEWVAVTAHWNSAERTLSLDVKDKRLADRTLDAGEELGHYLRLGVGSGIELEVRELYATIKEEEKSEAK